MNKLISLFLGWPIWVYALVGAGALLGSGYMGWTIRDWQCDSAKLRTIVKTIKIKEKNTERVNDEAVKHEQGNVTDKAAQRHARERIKVIYDSKAVYANCAVPDDARRVLEERVGDANSRARGQPPSALSFPSFTPQPLKRPREAPLGGRTHLTVWDLRFAS